MASPMSSASLIDTLSLKVFNFVLLLISLIILTTDTATAHIEILISTVTFKVHFNKIYAYRYMLATNVIGFAYTLLQIVFSFGMAAFNLISMVIRIWITKDLRATIDGMCLVIDKSIYEKAYGSTSLFLLSFVCTAILSVISSYALPRKV
ncbi:CASP-like protein 4D1 [Quercus suber]|uniref:CASP-like protein 4D1 n=1 Tax=Quercus suber TaxID=58331 RepID=UPI000CE288DC|nr:CASP-like protein 4D1 [Quercus suber]